MKGPPLGTLCHLARPERWASLRSACRRASPSSDRTLEIECNPELKKKKGPRWGPFIFFGAPGEIRTPDRSVRSRVLYPAELRAHCLLSRRWPLLRGWDPRRGAHSTDPNPSGKAVFACFADTKTRGPVVVSCPAIASVLSYLYGFQVQTPRGAIPCKRLR